MSNELQQYIDSIVEDVILNDASFDEARKYLKRFCDSEGVDYSALTEWMESLFEAISVYRKTGSESSRESIIQIGSRFLTEESLKMMMASVQVGDSTGEDEGERYGDLTVSNNRNLLLKNELFGHFPGVRDELMQCVGMEDFKDSCYNRYLPSLKELQSLEKAIRTALADDKLKASQGFVAFEFAANSFLVKIPSLSCEDLNKAQADGEKLVEIADQLRFEFERGEKRLDASIKNTHLDDVSVALLLIVIALIWWILSRDITLWLRIPTWCGTQFIPGELYTYADKQSGA